jgi:hypothetical protein
MTTPPAPALTNATTGQLQDMHRQAKRHEWDEILQDVRAELQRRATPR